MSISLAARVALATPLVPLATIFGIASGGFLAGKLAKAAGAYHGAIVGAGSILLAAIGAIPSSAEASDVIADTMAVIALEALTLAAASLGGWLATRASSSSGTGTAR